MILISYNLVRHAAHYAYDHQDRGHDLAQWVIESPTWPELQQVTALGLPDDAEYDSGHLFEGRQRWVYVARRPISPGTCSRCEATKTVPPTPLTPAQMRKAVRMLGTTHVLRDGGEMLRACKAALKAGPGPLWDSATALVATYAPVDREVRS